LHFADRLLSAIESKSAPVVVGIDPLLERLPSEIQPKSSTASAAALAMETFGRGVIDAVAPHVPAVKVNSAFFEAAYEHGVGAYFRLIEYAHERGLLVIGDIKRGDIGSTAKLYARGHLATPAFDDVRVERMPDAVTLAGYLGQSAVQPFVDIARETGRGVYVLVRPSDPGADRVHEFGSPDAPFYGHMAALIDEWGSSPEWIGECELSCVGAVVAPKDERSTRALRGRMPRTPWLVPGYGAQGATGAACAACFLPGGTGALVNASRSVIYAYEDTSESQRGGERWQTYVGAAARRFADELRTVAAHC